MLCILNDKVSPDMLRACSILKEIMFEISNMIDFGVNALDIDKKVALLMKNFNVVPAFLGKYNFPGNCCISINEVICHGIPRNYIFKCGDVVKIDICIRYKDFCADMCRTFLIGNENDFIDKKMLINFNKKVLLDLEDNFNSDDNKNKNVEFIAKFISKFAMKHKFGNVVDFGGHAIGHDLHLQPFIPNAFFEGCQNLILKNNSFLCIEPMFCLSNNIIVDTVKRGEWDVISKDLSISAHFEDTYFFDGNKLFNLTR